MSRTFRQRLAAGEQLLGTFIKTPSPMLCEVLAGSELDVLCIDAEHSPFDRLAQDQCIHAIRSGGMASLVRVPSRAPEHILNALDCGATGVVVPHVCSPEIAEQVGRAAHFGAGGRGYAGSTRAAGYTRKAMATHREDSAAETTVIIQIEDVEAVDAIDEIAAVDRVDCLFIGRIDLTVALGAASPKDPVVIAAVEKICRSAGDAGRPVGMFVGDLDELPRWRDAGASLFLLGSDHGFLLQGASALAGRFHGR